MGCNHSSRKHSVVLAKSDALDCPSDEIGKYLNLVRTNPSAYVSVLER